MKVYGKKRKIDNSKLDQDLSIHKNLFKKPKQNLNSNLKDDIHEGKKSNVKSVVKV